MKSTLTYPFTLVSLALVLAVQCTKKEAGPGPAGGAEQPKVQGAPPSPGGPGGLSGGVSPAVYNAVLAKGYAISREIQSPGSIQAEERTDLQAEISGRVTGIYFKEGSFVQKGALLVKLNDADLVAQRSKMEVQLKIAEASEKRQKELLAVNGTSQQEYDLATLQVSNIKADMDLNSVNLSKTEIRAPFSGRLGLRNISLGAYVSPQTILTNIAQVNTLKIEFNVIEKYTSELKQGKVVQFRTDVNQKVYQARIIAFENSLTNDTRQLRIRAQVIKPDASLTPGSFISVTFGVGSEAPAIMIPAQAIIPQARDKKVILFKNGAAVFSTVVTGYRDSSRVEVVQGLQTGDTILTTGLLSVRPGAKIKVQVTE